jgi:hypothetical protein
LFISDPVAVHEVLDPAEATVAMPRILVQIQTSQELGGVERIQHAPLAHAAQTIPTDVQELNGIKGLVSMVKGLKIII